MYFSDGTNNTELDQTPQTAKKVVEALDLKVVDGAHGGRGKKTKKKKSRRKKRTRTRNLDESN
jgi:hypothetical protein